MASGGTDSQATDRIGEGVRESCQQVSFDSSGDGEEDHLLWYETIKLLCEGLHVDEYLVTSIGDNRNSCKSI
jgi:hypothetical protein